MTVPNLLTNLRLKVVTPDAQVLDTEVVSVVLPAHDGEVGILPGHAPFLFELDSGNMRYTLRDQAPDAPVNLFIDGGTGHVRNNEVTVLTRQIIKPGQISKAQAEEMLLQAEAMSISSIEEVEARNIALRRARKLIKMLTPKPKS